MYWFINVCFLFVVFQCKREEMNWIMERGGTSNYQGADACYVRLRGLPFECEEKDISEFFKGRFIPLLAISRALLQKLSSNCSRYFATQKQ